MRAPDTFSVDFCKLAVAILLVLALVGVLTFNLTLAFVCIALLAFEFKLTVS